MGKVKGFNIDDASSRLIFNGLLRMHKLPLNKASISKYEKADGGYRLNRNGIYLLFGFYEGIFYVYVGESAKSVGNGVRGRLFCHIEDGEKVESFVEVDMTNTLQMKKFLTHAVVITDTEESTFLENNMNIVQALETIFTNMSIFPGKARSLNGAKTYHTIGAKDLELAQGIAMEIFDNLDAQDRAILKPSYFIPEISKKEPDVYSMRCNTKHNDTRVYMLNDTILKGSYFECGKNTFSNSVGVVDLLNFLFREKKLALVVKEDKFVYIFMEDLDIKTIETKRRSNDLESLAKLIANDYTATNNTIWRKIK